MNLRKCFTLMTIVSSSLVLPLHSRADFGEIDILVRESIENHFKEENRSVDLQKLSYSGEPQINGNQLLIQSSVWAEQRRIYPFWGWYDCTTKIEVKTPGQYLDRGSECIFDFD